MVDVLASNRMYVNDNTDLKLKQVSTKRSGLNTITKTHWVQTTWLSFKVFDTRIDESIVTTWTTSTSAEISNGEHLIFKALRQVRL